MPVIGYARVSLDEQNPDLQVRALQAAGAEEIYVDYATGATMVRQQLTTALEAVAAGDVFMMWRIDRLGRSLTDLVTQVNLLASRDVEFRSLNESIDTTTPGGRLVFHVFAAVAQFERELLVDRTKAGLAAARASGKPIGRPRLVTPERAVLARELRLRGATLQAIAKQLRVSPASVIRLLQMGQEAVPTPTAGEVHPSIVSTISP